MSQISQISVSPTPLVSIVITAYNDAATVSLAIESALSQDYAEKEVIVVVDGATDGTDKIAQRYADRVTVILQPNGGTASARNRGLVAAKGEWIQYLDADDVLMPEKVSRSLAALFRSPHKDDIALIYSGYYRVDSTGNHVLSIHEAADYARWKLLAIPGHVTPNPMLRTDLVRRVGGYSTSYIYAEDTELYHRLGLYYPMLAIREPLFFYRVSQNQKTQTMRQHARGNLIHIEPIRIRDTYSRLYEQIVPAWTTVPGKFSQRGVLDIGLKCTHSCQFCYYSYLDNTDDQFSGMRKASFRHTDECKSILQGFAKAGLTHFDVTGGEPTLHRDLPEIIRYAKEELGLRARIITLGQFLMRPMGKGKPNLIDELLDAGVDDFLFSTHAVDGDLFKQVTGESFEKLSAVMSYLDERGFNYCSNTVVYQNNYQHLPDIAKFIAQRRVRVANFIVMNAYFAWNKEGRVMGVQARYRDIKPYLTHAINILEEAGIGVDLRYGPYCAYKGLEKHFVGVLGVELDPYEWRSTLRSGAVKHYADEKQYVLQARSQLNDPNSMFTKEYGLGCEVCKLRPICDGVDSKYVAQYGWDEFKPYPIRPNDEPIYNAVHFRLDNPRALELKNSGPTRKDLIAPATADSLANTLKIDRTLDPVLSHYPEETIQEAIGIAQQQLTADPSAYGNYLALLQLYVSKQRVADAVQICQKLEHLDHVPTSLVLQARAIINAGLIAQLPPTRAVLAGIPAII